jgi:hypothetical protein
MARMKKGRVRVFDVVSRTFGFTFGNIFTLTRITWLPLILMFAIMIAFAVIFAALIDLQAVQFSVMANDPANLADTVNRIVREERSVFGAIAVTYGLMMLLITAIYAMIGVAVMRIALLGERPKGIFYLRFGGREWRFFFVYLLLTAIYLIGYGALHVAVFVFSAGMMEGVPAGPQSPFVDPMALLGTDMTAGQVMALSLVAVAVSVWLYIKLHLMLPVTAAEGRFGLWRSLALTWGNVWRILFTYILGFITFMVVWVVLALAVVLGIAVLVFGMDFISAMMGSGEAIENARGAGTTIGFILLAFLLIILAFFMLCAFVFGFWYGLTAFIYKAAAGGDVSSDSGAEESGRR